MKCINYPHCKFLHTLLLQFKTPQLNYQCTSTKDNNQVLSFSSNTQHIQHRFQIMICNKYTKLVIATLLTTFANALLTNPTRTIMHRDIKTPDPVPQSGIEEAVSLMSTGRMYRYNVLNAQESTVSKCEVEIAKYTGHKYCVALNSCGSAIMLMMKCAGLEYGDEVLSNAFTFGAVPSAIEHAGGKVR